MISQFTNKLLNEIKGKSKVEKIKILLNELQLIKDEVVFRELRIALRMLEEEKFIYVTDNFTNSDAMNELHNQIKDLLEIKK